MVGPSRPRRKSPISSSPDSSNKGGSTEKNPIRDRVERTMPMVKRGTGVERRNECRGSSDEERQVRILDKRNNWKNGFRFSQNSIISTFQSSNLDHSTPDTRHLFSKACK